MRCIMKFTKVVVANRGDVARRIIRALTTLKISSVAVYSEADASAPYLSEADEAYCIGPAPALSSYLNQDAILKVIKKSGADAVHPGYGFLSENWEFAKKVEENGVCFIGPSYNWIRDMGNKNLARNMVQKYGMPVAQGSDTLGTDMEEILNEGRRIGFPVLIKPAGGGGGIGMLPAHNESELKTMVERARFLANRSFNNDQLYMEKLFVKPRHIEFQVLADRYGNVQHLFERDCSIQRRHQKVIEESPSPNVREIDRLAEQIQSVLERMGYDNIGTVEMLRGNDGSFHFLEMNTRLQVEHAVTEEITGIDLVISQIKLAAGESLSDVLPETIERNGHAIEARVYAEDPVTFFPSPGRLTVFRPPVDSSIRIETGYQEGMEVTPYYDPMIAKVIVHENTRNLAIKKLQQALLQFDIQGIKTNIPFIIDMLKTEEFLSGNVHTGLSTELIARGATLG
ncbi:biotin carboxylase [Bacillus sp. MRMR6]|nr:biotin carboxylase [Bacillus sp. MRMR6]